MAVKLTKEQMKILKGMIEVAENFSDQMLHVIKNHKLDKIDGCRLSISIEPEMLFSTEFIQFGDINRDSGIIRLTKGRRCKNEKWTPFGKNSTEYELLFADESIRSRMEEIVNGEKPLPSDGLWISRFDDPYPVDSGWDVNE